MFTYRYIGILVKGESIYLVITEKCTDLREMHGETWNISIIQQFFCTMPYCALQI